MTAENDAPNDPPAGLTAHQEPLWLDTKSLVEAPEARPLGAALAVARRLMDAHGLTGWSVGVDRGRRRAGQCDFDRRTITLSRHFVTNCTEFDLREICLHEIAHALVGPGHHHDEVWRRTARRIGGSGSTRYHGGGGKEAPWIGRCPAGHTVDRFRRPERPMSCGACSRVFSPDHLFTWSHRGRPVDLGHDVSAAGDPATARAAGPGPGREWRLTLPPGTRVQLLGGGKYGGLAGTIERLGRTRYHVRTGRGVLSVPPSLIAPLDG